MLYPLKFEPVYKNYIWGGRNLSRYRKALPDGAVAESWDLSCHPDGISVVSEGSLKGITLPELLKIYKSKLLGSDFPESYSDSFPLLVKLIDANDKLSVQVHPDDEYAMVFEDANLGKNEMWYVIDAKPGAKLVCGLKPGTTKESFSEAIRNGNIDDYLSYLEVKPGDIVNIPAGVVHAIGEGILIAEIQQNSNTTYRVYDYDRVDKSGNKRPLHIAQALDVINFSACGTRNKRSPLSVKVNDEFSKSYVVANRFFAAEIYDLNGKAFEEADGSKFFIYTFLEGHGEINYNNGNTCVNAGDTVLIPASLGSYILKGSLKCLKSYIPNLHVDVVLKLKTAGFSKESIYDIVAAGV
jgi:mannose-6-phosphate isomerase